MNELLLAVALSTPTPSAPFAFQVPDPVAVERASSRVAARSAWEAHLLGGLGRREGKDLGSVGVAVRRTRGLGRAGEVGAELSAIAVFAGKTGKPETLSSELLYRSPDGRQEVHRQRRRYANDKVMVVDYAGLNYTTPAFSRRSGGGLALEAGGRVGHGWKDTRVRTGTVDKDMRLEDVEKCVTRTRRERVRVTRPDGSWYWEEREIEYEDCSDAQEWKSRGESADLRTVSGEKRSGVVPSAYAALRYVAASGTGVRLEVAKYFMKALNEKDAIVARAGLIFTWGNE